MQRSYWLVLLLACGGNATTNPLGPSGDTQARAPSQPAVTAQIGDKRVTLSWSDAGVGVGYQIYRGIANVAGDTQIGSTTERSFTDDQELQNCVSYIYTVRAENALGKAEPATVEAVPSSDVSCWTRKTASPSWSDMASVSSVSVAVGDANYYKRSTSPGLWNNLFLPSRQAFNSIVAYNNEFYAGTAEGAIWTSTDGAVFTKKTDGVPGTRMITVGSTLLRLSGNDVRLSSDGSTWTTALTGATSPLVDVAYGNNIVLAAFETGFVVSNDYGSHWSTVPLSAPIDGKIKGLAYGQSPGITGFVAVTQLGSILYSSFDGLTWQFAKAYPNQIAGVAYNEQANVQSFAVVFSDGHVLVFNNPGALPNALSQSLPATNEVLGVRYNGQFQVLGAGDMILSSNGLNNTWQQQSLGGSWHAIEAGQNSVIAVGSSSRIARTTDGGESWADRHVDGSYVLRGIAYGLGRWVACGELSAGSTEGAVFVSKDDGENWTRAAGMNERCLTVRFLNGRFYAGLKGHTIRTWTGVDGQGWSQAFTQGTSYPGAISDIAFSTKFIAVTSDSSMVYGSADGNTWVPITPGLLNMFNTGALGLAYLGGAFVAYGISPGLARSNDGGLWMPIASEFNFTRVRQVNNKQVAVGGNDELYVSTNGTSWVKDTVFPGASVTDFVQVGSRLIGVGPDATYVRIPPK